MSSIEIKIFGQKFLINPPEGMKEHYLNIASLLDKMMSEESFKEDLRSDIKIAVKVAFLLAAENADLKADHEKSLKVLEKIDRVISSHVV